MKILSRKVLASLVVFITATLFLWYSKIDGYNWVILAVGTLVGYIAGEEVGYLVKYLKERKNPAKVTTIMSKEKQPIGKSVVARLKNLLTPSFIAAIVVYAVGTFMLWHGKISTTEWVYVALGMIIGYDVLNPLEKLR